MLAKEREQHWLRLVKRWRTSGLSQAEFYRRENVTVELFYAWRQKLEHRQLLAPFVQQPATSNAVKQHEFVPVQISEHDGLAKGVDCLEISTPSGYVVRIP
jgi:transposase-like protein